ncbi:hypothetical protein KP005_19355 [Geomonas nitrogeniifigens]|uniref:DUF5681 domain-containing protein n=1 Tax=Geomonas diazotrophica TaxID=2843197 RepID=A0ABX8JGE5_9BACT|nr:DUF5681 domain-containing protein [Geomonas nitrogeniifigens]QWV97465.1 hypothetical protein KP005_19355 [Geomonas nitrogeniifigens]
MARFQKGQSGNPAGKPPGTKDKRTELRALLKPHAPALIQKVVDLALEGDSAALRMCLDRLVPPVKATAEPVQVEATEGSLAEQAQAIYQQAANGELGPDEAGALIGLLQAQAKIIEISELEARITALEKEKQACTG